MGMTQYILLVGGLILLSFVYQGVAMYMHSMSKKKFESENPDASIMVIKDCQWHFCRVWSKRFLSKTWCKCFRIAVRNSKTWHFT